MSAIFGLIEDIGPLLGVVGTIFWVWMLVDSLNRANLRSQRGWFVLLLFTHWIGALIYFLIYVYPPGKFSQAMQQQPHPTQKQPPVYYTPPVATSYQEYQQGYQPQSVPSPAPAANVPYQQEDQQQPSYTTVDYEEPYATYPEMPPQQQQ